MASQLNIKDAETHELARRLAAARKTSAAAAVKQALQEALAREPQPEDELATRRKRILAIASEMRAGWTDPRSPEELRNSLYDEWGAPI